MDKEKEKLSSLDKEALKKEVLQLKKEIFNLKMNASTMHVKDYSQFKKLRKRTAQAFTYLNQKMKEQK